MKGDLTPVVKLAPMLVLAISACATEPSVVTKVVIEYPTVADSWFVTEPFPGYPPRPVTLAGMVEVFERGRALYAVCQGNLREIRDLIRPPAEEPPCTEEGRTDCR